MSVAKPTNSPRRNFRYIITFLIITTLAGSGLLWQGSKLLHQQADLPTTIFILTLGNSLSQVASALKQQELIPSARLFSLYARWHGQQSKLQAGEYVFSGTLNTIEILHILTRGKVRMHRVTIAEGLRTRQVLHHLAKQTDTDIQIWEQALQSLLGHNQEGRLLPETYSYALPVNPKIILKQMIRAQQALLKNLNSDMYAEDIRIKASIIEKETALDNERPLVASVIENRLQKHMPLQMDPTVIYGIWQTKGEFTGSLHRRDLMQDTAWNSYTRKGLPPTPICNPGLSSLRAAAAPASSSYLFFVANGEGGHAFASTLLEHQQNVRNWLKRTKK